MIIDQLFTPKPLQEGGPYDLPGKDYDRPGDAPRKRPSGEQNPYPYSPEEDDDYFREIFRKKREAAAKDPGMAEGNGRDLTNTPRDQFISRMTPSMDANALRQKVAKIVNSPGFTEDTILQIVDAGDNLSHPAGRYIQQAFYGLQYNLGKEYEDYPERVAEKLLSQFRSMLPAYRVAEEETPFGSVSVTNPPSNQKPYVEPSRQDIWDKNDLVNRQAEAREQKQLTLRYARKHGRQAMENLWAERTDVRMRIEEILEFLDATINDPGLTPEEFMGTKGLDEGSGQDSKSWIASIEQQHPGVRFVQAKMPGAPIIALVNGKPVAQFDTKKGVAEDLNRRGFMQGLGMAAVGAAGLGAAGAAQARATPEWTSKVERAKTLMAKGQSREQTARIMGIKGPNPGGTGPMFGDWGAVNSAAQEMRVKESTNRKQRRLNEALELYFGKNSKPISEGNRNNQLRLMEETTFRNGYAFARLLVEKNLTKDQVLQLFKDVEQGATDAGGNRTGLGKAKDATTQAIGKASKLVQDAMQWARERPTMQAVDTEYNRAMTALGKLGGKDGEANAITQAIYKYRDAAKKYPRATGLAKWAIISAASLVTGGLGGVGVAAGLAAIDAAIKDKDVTDILGASVQAALVSGAIQGAGDLASAASDAYNGMPSASDVASAADPGAVDTGSQGNQLTPQQQLDAGVDRFEIEAAQNWVNADPAVRAEIEKILQLTPDEIQKIADSNLPRLGGTGPSDVGALADPGSTPGMGAGFAGGQYTVQDGDQIGYIAQAMGVKPQDITGLNPQIDFTKPLKLGTVLDLPQQGDNAGNLWTDYVQGSNYGDKVPGATGGRQFDLATADAAQNAAADTQAAADYAAASPAEKAEIIKTTGITADQLDKMAQQAGTAPIDYTKPGPESTDSLGQKLEYGIPVNDKGSFVPPNPSLPAEELAKQTAAYDAWKADFMKRNPNTFINAAGNPVQIMTKPTLPAAVQESVKFKIIPAEQLIDQKLTVLSWALNESVNRKGHQSVHLTTKGVRTVFENIGRCRRAYLKEYIGAPTADYGHPTAAGAPASATAGQGKPQGWFGKTLDTIGRGVDKVGSYVSNVGHNVITKVTADKLNNMWNRAGEPYDSNRLYQLLTTEWGVPKQVVDSVFSKMGIPYTAPATVPAAQTATPATTGGAQKSMPFYGTNPATGKPRTYDELLAKSQAGTKTTTSPEAPTPTDTAKPVAGTFPGEDPKGPGYVGRREVARRQAARDAEAAKKPAAPNFAPQGGGYKSVNYAPNIKTGINLPKPTAPAAPTKTPTQAERDAYVRSIGAPAMAETRIATALKKPVAEMLQMVETKEDVQRIKQFVDDTFVRYGAVNESAFALRNQILEHVTQTGAQRRREHSQRMAT